MSRLASLVGTLPAGGSFCSVKRNQNPLRAFPPKNLPGVRGWTCGDSQAGPKSECHTKELNVLFSSITAGKMRVSPGFGPFWSTRPTAAGNRPHTAKLEALALEAETTSGVDTPRDAIRHLCDPTGTRADYGPTHKTKSNHWGFKRGVPLLWLFVHFGHSKWTPAERVSPRQGKSYA